MSTGYYVSEALIKLQYERIGILEDICEEVEQRFGVEKSKWEAGFSKNDINVRLERVKAVWDKFEATYEKLCESGPDDSNFYKHSRTRPLRSHHNLYMKTLSMLITLKESFDN
ncbi:uncharacterized protein LOC122511773 [Leptopilina heterotoma]|uniref:uncharacterized protein LOC122511773 n=1 Tax=Leptopilina heterotoma TaxID=63436 RepID=UPI001CA91130|nr:uncharacterized protein LOC122511773 [Leptopilina heterotoma]XP_043483182.1 uncharacterized protein LOC122511773 [Leptopilina heterotoma]